MMRINRLMVSALAPLLLMISPLQANEPVSASKFASYMVGAEQVRIRNGDENLRGVMNQSLVTYIETNFNNGNGPVMMVPDVGLSSWIYARTPDNRDGWLEGFARLGHDAYAFDWINTGNSPQNILPFALLNQGAICYSHEGCDSSDNPLLQRIDKLQPAEFWSLWGFGPAQGEAWPDSQYPLDQVMQLYSSLPAFATYVNNEQDLIINARNLIQALEDNGPANLILHGAAAETGAQVARLRPDLVTSLVLLEPTSCQAVEPLDQIPVLAVYGDYLEQRDLTDSLRSCVEALNQHRRDGGEADLLTLAGAPGLGDLDRQLQAVRIPVGANGNSHLMMQDANNLAIAGMISRWIDLRLN